MAKKQSEEVKMALSSKGCKTVCKVTYVIAKICEIFCIIAAVALCVAGVLFGLGHKTVNMSEFINEMNVQTNDSLITLGGEAVNNFLAKSHNQQVTFILVAMVVAIMVFAFASVLARHTGKFFKNLVHGKTPFTMENVDLLQKMATWIFATVITIDLGSLILALMLGGEQIVASVSLSQYLLGFIVLVFAVIFRHGVELEKGHKK